MRDFREILGGSLAGADSIFEVSKEDLKKHKMTPAGMKRPKMKKGKLYSWDNINTALVMSNFSAKIIARILSNLNRVVKERLTVGDTMDKIDEMTTAGAGVGDYSPPLGMSRRDKDKFSSTTAMLKQFDQCTATMGRAGMLKQCRNMGLSLGHLKDDDIRKTLTSMSVRNKRKFMGVSMGMGMGHIDKWTKSPKKV